MRDVKVGKKTIVKKTWNLNSTRNTIDRADQSFTDSNYIMTKGYTTCDQRRSNQARIDTLVSS